MNLPLIWHGKGSLASRLSCGFRELTVIRAQHGRATEVRLRGAQESVIVIQSQMHDIGSRKELGALELVEADSSNFIRGEFIALPESLNFPGVMPNTLTIAAEGFTAVSGLIWKAPTGHSLIVVAADYPYTLAIFIDSLSVDDADSEYPLSEYVVAPLAVA